MVNLICVFVGGGLGALCRYGISKFLPWSSGAYPWATFLANLISCIIIGLLFGVVMQKELSSRTQLLLITGFCGGFSTFSTFSLENYQLIEDGFLGTALGYMAASIITCLVAVFIGIKLAEKILT